MIVVKSDASKDTKYYNKREPSFGNIISFICILWSLFQLWIASDFPFYLSEITKLNELHKSGVLTQEEFEKAKNKLLNN